MLDVYIHAVVFLLGLAGTTALFSYGRKWAIKARLIDRPGGRKQHQGAVPLIGGLIIIPVFIILYALTSPVAMPEICLFISLIILLIMGWMDDRQILSPTLKFSIQILAAMLVVIGGNVHIDTFGHIWGEAPVMLGMISIPFTIACLVMTMNAINMMDGLDGLAGGVSMVITLALAAAAHMAKLSMTPYLCLIIPLIVFVAFNMRHPWRERAAVFLGDSGSLTLGLIVGWMCIRMAQSAPDIFPPVSAIWLLGIPVIDALMLFFLRLFKGRHPFAADRNHLHHRFLSRGFSVRTTTYAVMMAAGVCAVIGLSGLNEKLLFWAWIFWVIIYMAMGLRPSARREF